MRAIKFAPEAFKEYNDWEKTDKATFRHIAEIIIEITRDPFKGVANPNR